MESQTSSLPQPKKSNLSHFFGNKRTKRFETISFFFFINKDDDDDEKSNDLIRVGVCDELDDGSSATKSESDAKSEKGCSLWSQGMA